MYMPSMDSSGNYIDNIKCVKKGVYCPCGSRKDKLYESSSVFSVHTKSKCHQKWLSGLNTNKANYVVENHKLVEVITNQRLIIAKLDKDNTNRLMIIELLTQQLSAKTNIPVNNLLDFD